MNELLFVCRREMPIDVCTATTGNMKMRLMRIGDALLRTGYTSEMPTTYKKLLKVATQKNGQRAKVYRQYNNICGLIINIINAENSKMGDRDERTISTPKINELLEMTDSAALNEIRGFEESFEEQEDLGFEY